MRHGPDPYTRCLELLDEWLNQHPQPTAQLLTTITQLHNTKTTGDQLAALLTTITNTERERTKGAWQIVISNQLLTDAVFTLQQWRQLTETTDK